MPTIDVTDEQLDRLEAVREDVSAALAGPYGHVRTQDALEYLLDTYTPPGETEVEDAPTASEESAGSELVALDPIGPAKAAALERAGYETAADLRAATAAELTEVQGIGETLAGRILAAVGAEPPSTAASEPTEEPSTDAGDDADGSDDATDDTGTGDSGADRLNAMMSLLDQHEDKWGESGGDEPYEVELPDGSVETARTKDDVRGLLFRHYR